MGERGEGFNSETEKVESKGSWQIFNAETVYGTETGMQQNVSILVNPDGVIESIESSDQENADLVDRKRQDKNFKLVTHNSEVILPSLTDAHNHPICLPEILSTQPGFIFGITSEDRLREKLISHFEEKDKNGSSNQLELVIGWDTSSMPNISAAKLDTVREFPFIIMDASYHGAVGNSSAIKKVINYVQRNGLENILHGNIDATTGQMREEYALLGLEIMETEMDLSQVSASINDYLQEAHRGGSGYVHEMNLFTPAQQELYASLPTETRKIISQVYASPRTLKNMIERNIDLSQYGLKLLADGSFGSFSALMYEPYVGTDKYGLEYQTEKDAVEAMEFAADHGVSRIATHAIGDHGIDNAIKFSKLWKEISERHGLNSQARIEHFSLPREDSLKRAADLGLTIVTQPNFETDIIPYSSRLGPERASNNIPLRRLIDTGLKTVFGTDGMPNSMSVALHCAMTHPNESQRLTFEEAIRASAQTAPQIEESGRSGVIKVGASADLVLTNKRFIDKVTGNSGLFEASAKDLDKKVGEVTADLSSEIQSNTVGGKDVLKPNIE